MFCDALVLFMSSYVMRGGETVCSMPRGASRVTLSSNFYVGSAFNSRAACVGETLLCGGLRLLGKDSAVVCAAVRKARNRVLLPVLGGSGRGVGRGVDGGCGRITCGCRPVNVCTLSDGRLGRTI